jgi:hypothetical protein
MDTVAFITTQTGTDLIVSFVLVRDDDPEGIESLTLLRTPKYEPFLDEEERGVTVALELQEGHDLLVRAHFDKDAATIRLKTQSREYDLDLRKVDPIELEHMSTVFRKMNFDRRLELSGLE